MSTVTLPLNYTGLAITQLNQPLSRLPRTITALQPDELLIRARYSSINPLELKFASVNPFGFPLPLWLGGDFSGTVVAAGGEASEGQDAIGVGSEVFGFCVANGAWGEYVVVKRVLTVLRGAIPARVAGTYGGVYLTAVDMLVDGEVSKRKGQWAYVAGAAGGVGHVAIQMAKLHGLRVIGSASKPAALDLLKSLGVDHIIDYSKQDVVAEVLAATGGKGADLVYDPTYEDSSYAQSAACVASGGVWMKLGENLEPGSEQFSKIAEARGAKALTPTLGRWLPEYGGKEPLISQRSILTQALRDAVQWYESGQLRVHVSKTVECEPNALQQAFQDFYKMNVGKVAVHVGGDE